jgi:VWFA-related protein
VAVVVSIALSPQRPIFRAGVDTVEVYATVSDRGGRLVPNLPREEFQLLSDGKPVELTVFSNEIKTLTAVVLIDTSGSTVERLLWFRQAVGYLVDALQGDDRLRIGSFGEEIAISPHLTGDKDLLKRILRDELWPGGGTPLWRAMLEGIYSLASEGDRRVVLVMSDGVNVGGSRLLENDVRRGAVEGGFMIYAISAQAMGLGLLKDIAGDTGGGYLEVRADADLKETMTRGCSARSSSTDFVTRCNRQIAPAFQASAAARGSAPWSPTRGRHSRRHWKTCSRTDGIRRT